MKRFPFLLPLSTQGEERERESGGAFAAAAAARATKARNRQFSDEYLMPLWSSSALVIPVFSPVGRRWQIAPSYRGANVSSSSVFPFEGFSQVPSPR